MNVSELIAKANQRLVDQKDEITKLKALCSRANNYMRLMDGEEFELDQSFGTLKDELREAAK